MAKPKRQVRERGMTKGTCKVVRPGLWVCRLPSGKVRFRKRPLGR